MAEDFPTRGRRAVIATMHGKERVMAPILAGMLGLDVSVAAGIDTDRFGTFTREIARAGGQQDALRAKARAALELDPNADFAVASEGSFGPDPVIPFMGIGRELVMIVERHSGAEVVGTDVTRDTNYAHRIVDNTGDGLEFARQTGAPEHSIVVMFADGDAPDPARPIAKGLRSLDDIQLHLEAVLKQAGRAFIETDMRAHHNPTRMKSIERATLDAARRWQSRCPGCGYPGWGIVRRVPGRKCGWCGNPTRLPEADVYACGRCGHEVRDETPGLERADPGVCDYCNP
jgi:DNA-directed RNA polymerase subunit RPC12/RpoP